MREIRAEAKASALFVSPDISSEAMDLRTALSDPQLTMDKLLMLYVHEIQQRAKVQVEQVAPDAIRIQSGTDNEHTVYLQNLWRELRYTPDISDRLAAFENYLSVILLSADRETLFTKDNIVPIIKDDEYLKYSPDPEKLVLDHLAGDLWVVYAVDLPTCTQTLLLEDMYRLGVKRNGIRSLALENLRRILPEANCDGEGPWYTLSAGPVYSASLLLLEEVWTQVESMVDGDIVSAIPSRDVVLFTGSKSADGIRLVRDRAYELYAGGHHTVSKTLLRRNANTWIVFE